MGGYIINPRRATVSPPFTHNTGEQI